MNATQLARVTLGVTLIAASAAHATNGYLSHGYGTRTKGTAGVAAALPQDALVIAANPAGLIALDNRLDVGIEFFAPDRSSSITGNAFGPDQEFDGNGREVFVIPEFGYSHRLRDDLVAGVAIYGNGGMNTDYDENPYARFGSTGKSYMNLEQLFLTPAIAWEFVPGHTLGVGIDLAYQRFEAKGLSAFTPFSIDPANVTNNGSDHSYGMGLRIGWLGRITDRLTLGAAWQSKTQMDEFKEYAGLFAQGGGFDVPENYVLGAAFEVIDGTTVAIDWQTIKYSDVPSVGHSVTLLWLGNPLGSENGPGFGWEDMSVLKLGVVHTFSDRLTLRAGFSHGDQPIPREETFFNIIAPGVVERHASIGATWAFSERHELSLQYTHVFEHDVNGRNSIPPGFPPAGLGGGEANLELSENSFGIAWTFRLR